MRSAFADKHRPGVRYPLEFEIPRKPYFSQRLLLSSCVVSSGSRLDLDLDLSPRPWTIESGAWRFGPERTATQRLSDPQIALYPVIIAATWNAVGLPMLLYLAGLQTIPEELHEAAKVEGAGPIQRFFYITFPLLRETTLVVLAITAINALKAYDIIYAMTNGGPANRTQVLSTWMYFLTYNYNQVGLGTAIAVVLFSLTLIFAIPYIRFMTRKT